MRPAIRSTFDVVTWLEAKAGQDNIELEPSTLMQLIYLSQAIYAAENKKAKLMPATFLATEVGPIEPDLFLALEHGVAISENVAPSQQVEEVLIGVWDAFIENGDEALAELLSADIALKNARKRGRNSEVLVGEMAGAYPGGLETLNGNGLVSKFPDGSPYNAGHSNLDAAPTPSQEVRFTADGRSVTRWVPKKKMRSKDIKK
jgi:uncharacterized phage-associated protein